MQYDIDGMIKCRCSKVCLFYEDLSRTPGGRLNELLTASRGGARLSEPSPLASAGHSLLGRSKNTPLHLISNDMNIDIDTSRGSRRTEHFELLWKMQFVQMNRPLRRCTREDIARGSVFMRRRPQQTKPTPLGGILCFGSIILLFQKNLR